jgi:putative DNA primase/helicase
MIPYRDAQGSDTGNIRLKPDKPLVNDDGRERKYEAPKLRPSRAYFPPGTITALADPTAPLLVTEGEKKALKAEQEGFPCVGLSGVWNWVKKQVEVEPAAGPRQRHLIDDLAAVPWKGRPVYIVFDSDAARNENVREAQFALAVQLMERGAVVKIVNLPDGPEGDDGEPTKVGLDDYLVAHPADDLRKLIEGATDPEEIEPREGRPVETFKDPHRLAAGFLKSRKQHPIRPGVHFWDDQWWYWNGKVYAPVPASLVNADVTKFVKQEFDRKNVEDVKRWRAARRAYEAKAAADKAAGRTTGSASPGELPPAVAPVTTGVVNNTIQAARAITHLDPSLRPPVWVESPDRPPAGEMLAFDNGLPHWPSYLEGKMGAFVPHTPAFFGQTLADFPFDPAAPPPAAWLEFLGQLWPSDPDSVATLQEVFGYLLTDDTSRQKIIGVIGPRRSGKGTIARVLTALLGGDQAVASVTLAGLSNEFGLAPLLDKRLAIIPDARVSREADMAVMAERLLSISGEDAQTVNRKNKDHILGRLRVRFLFMSNEVPQLLDTSGALPGRFLLLKLTESWYGREDVNLLPRLLAELPGILLWSLDGLRRLRARGHFVQPTRATDLVEQMEELASPLGAFVRERCLVSPDQFVFAEDLRAAWHAWAKEKGYANYEWTPGVFGRNIRSVVPTADREQRRHPQTSKAVGAYVGLGLKPAA